MRESGRSPSCLSTVSAVTRHWFTFGDAGERRPARCEANVGYMLFVAPPAAARQRSKRTAWGTDVGNSNYRTQLN
jgi:hypothetical protein